MSLTAFWPTQFRHRSANPKGVVTVQASTLYSPARPQACPPRTFRLWGLSPLLADASAPPLPSSISSYAQLGAGLAAFGSPPPGRCKYLFPPRGPRRGHLPASLPPCRRGPFPAREQQPQAAVRRKRSPCWCCSVVRRSALRRRPGSSPLWGAPLPRLRSAPREAGLRFLSAAAAAAVAAATVSFRWGEARNGPVGSPPPFPRPEPPLLARRKLVSVEFPLHPDAVSSVLGSVEVTALEEEAAAAALACRPRFGARGPGEEVPPPPPLPPSRCPRAGLGRAAMPSDFISLLSADLDLESPKSLYSRGESGWGLGRGGGEAQRRGAGGVPVGGGCRAPAGMACLGGWGEAEEVGGWWKGPRRSGGPSPAEPPAARGPNAVGPRVSADPVALSAPRRSGPATLFERPALASPARGSPRTGPCAGAAAIRLLRLLLPGPSSPAKLPPNGWHSLERVLGSGSPFFSLSRLFVRRRSAPLSLRPSPLPPLVGTAPLDQASFFPRHLMSGKSPNFLSFSFFVFSSLCTSVAF